MSTQQIEQHHRRTHGPGPAGCCAGHGEGTAVALAQTQVTAPDDGVISARTAAVGAVAPAGQELFRLIVAAGSNGAPRWRRQIWPSSIPDSRSGLRQQEDAVAGRLRMLAPVIDLQTRNSTAYVDLPPNPTVRAGMFARQFELGANQG